MRLLTSLFAVGIALGGIGTSGADLAEGGILPRQSGPGKTILIKPEDLPQPFATPNADNGPQLVKRPDGAELNLPPGFKAEVFAEGFDNLRWLTVAPNGDVFVVESGPGRVTLLRDTNGSGKADVREVFAEKLTRPFGVNVWKDWLYVANTDSLLRFPYKAGQTKAEGASQKVADMPGLGYHGHWTRNVVFSPKSGKMYITVGSHVDLGEEEDARRAAILEMNPDGTQERIYAKGLRNPVGLCFQPGSGQMWSTVNERDNMGDYLSPDYVTSIKEGGFYGWPYYYIGPHHDPRMPEKPELKSKCITPDVLIQPHSAALGMAFYSGKMFPKEYQGDAFVALHGSANCSKRTGYKIIRIRFKNGKPVGGYEDFLTGWMLGEDDKRVWGRPVGVAVAKDGALLVTDDGANKIWRISYSK